jgi:MFS family permease
LIWQVGTLIGPPLAGVIIATSGFVAIYALDAMSFIAVLLAVRMIRYQPAIIERRAGNHWSAIREGLRFAHGSSLIWQTLLIDLYATFFASARAMVPLIASNVLHVGVRGYGFLASAQAVGAFIAGTLLTLRRDIQRQGVVLFTSVAAFGLAWMLFGLVDSFVLAYLFYSLTGATDTVSYVIRTTLRQTLTPDELRGRVAGIHMTLGDAGPALGELESGVVASFAGAPIAIVAGGLATFVVTIVAASKWKGLRNYQSIAVEGASQSAYAEL